ncbi:MAG TPA: cyclopropane-fatty-acyl-phospholipid synthase family protein [Nitrospira sp.]
MDTDDRPSILEGITAPDMNRSTIRSAIGFFEDLLRGCETPNIAVRFWDGSVWRLRSDARPTAMLILRHEDSLSRMLRAPIQLSLGEAYIYDDIDVVGSLDAFLPLADHLLTKHRSVMEWIRCLNHTWRQRHLTRFPEEIRRLSLEGRLHEKRRDKEAVRFHYDLPVEFFRLWLDSRLVYSCGYYRQPDDDLDDAQTQKLEYLCRKLQLRDGDHILDLSCGWGGFALYAAQTHGAIVHGITLSRRQAEVANQRITALGLSRRCRIEVRDFRDVQGEALYDKIVSIGMVEHVGRAYLESFYQRAMRLLTPGGMFLNQGIGARDGQPKLGSFADRYVFPDAELLPIQDLVRVAESAGFEVRDVETLREHYALTLDAWRHNLEQQREKAVKVVGEVTYRVWRLYMAMAAYYFRLGRLSLYQTLCVKAIEGKVNLPLTRESLYEPRAVARYSKKEAA